MKQWIYGLFPAFSWHRLKDFGKLAPILLAGSLQIMIVGERVRLAAFLEVVFLSSNLGKVLGSDVDVL